jgi:ankyrin repeat protein
MGKIQRMNFKEASMLAAYPRRFPSVGSVLLLAAAVLVSTAIVSAAEVDATVVDAAERQDVEALQALIAEGADVNVAQADGATALQWAAHWDDLDTVDLLLKAGADANAANDLGVTALMLACENGSASVVERLLESEADPNAMTSTGESVLMRAARTGSVGAVSALLEAGGDATASEPSQEQTALMWAAAQGHAGVAQALIEEGADLHARSLARRRTVHIGSRYGDRTSYTGVVDTNKGGYTALLFAARNNQIEAARALVEAGANVDDVTADGTSALTLAAHSGHGEFAAFLLSHGADANARGSGYTALHAAVLRGDVALVEALGAAGANLEARLLRGTQSRYWGKDFALNDTLLVGATPLWLAARYADVPVMRALVAAGADPRGSFDPPERHFKVTDPIARLTMGRVDAKGTTTLMAAIKAHGGGGEMGDRRDRFLSAADTAGKPEDEDEQVTIGAVEASLELGADVGASDVDGNTALHLAASRRLDSVVQLLADAGADVNATNAEGQSPLALLAGPGGRPGASGEGRTAELLRTLGAVELSPDPVDVAEVPPLPATEAAGFLGDWLVTIQGPTGPIELDLLVTDLDGNVVVELNVDGMEEPQVVTQIVKQDDALALDYTLAVFGQSLPVSSTLALDREELTVVLDVMGGQFSLEGTGVRK